MIHFIQNMQPIQQRFEVPFEYTVHFTSGLFHPDNPLLCNTLKGNNSKATGKLFVVIDSGVADSHPGLVFSIRQYAEVHKHVFGLFTDPIIVPGGEAAKNDPAFVTQIQQIVSDYGIDRHSFIATIGGGALLDMVGFAAAISHRGIRHIRIPTTVLAQNDSGIGVKNGINAFHKKNFLGTFSPPFAVLNDFDFLLTLDERDWRSGISEAIKVALIKDAAFFRFIGEHTLALSQRDLSAMQSLIYRCAQLHLEHIGGGDPFERGSSRPLDFGHWAAHKLEQLTHYELRHGEAVAIGIALDSTYSFLVGMLSKAELERILEVLDELGFDLYHPALVAVDEETQQSAIAKGLTEFREHLGGELTIMLLERIGKGIEMHQMDQALITEAIQLLKTLQLKMEV